MNDSQREYYAQEFNTAAHNVRTWEEMNDTQKRMADCMFIGNGPEWIYCVATWGGSVVARRRQEGNTP